jgi:hypothetical protein
VNNTAPGAELYDIIKTVVPAAGLNGAHGLSDPLAIVGVT